MTEAPWLDEHEQRVWRQWVHVAAQLPASLQRALQEEAGLSLPDYEVLVRLTDTDEGRVRISELARLLTWEKSRLSHHLTRMERRGLIRREECVDDGRGAFVVITGEGRAAIERAAPGHVRVVRSLFFDPLSPADVVAMDAALGKLAKRLAPPHGS